MREPLLGELIRELRKSLGDKEYTQGELAKSVGVLRSMIAHCEAENTTPGDEVLQGDEGDTDPCFLWHVVQPEGPWALCGRLLAGSSYDSRRES